IVCDPRPMRSAGNSSIRGPGFPASPSPCGRGCREAAGEGKKRPHPALFLMLALSGSRFARATFSRWEKDSLQLFQLTWTALVIDRAYSLPLAYWLVICGFAFLTSLLLIVHDAT